MNEKEALRRRIYAVRFAMWELHLFLDTHPDNKEAAKKHEEYRVRDEALTKEYEEKFGAVVGATPQNTTRWAWICDPWPWEKEAE